jgi:excisionase family DNA binding protein
MTTPARIADTPHDQQHYSVPEAAARLKVSRATLYNMIAADEITSFKIRKRRFVAEAACRDFLSLAQKKAR